MSKLLRVKAELEGTLVPAAGPPAALQLIREIWASAVACGHQQQDALVDQLPEELTAVAVENKRWEGLALESMRRREDAEAERDQSVEEHRIVQADWVKAASQAQQVLDKLADARAAHATEMAAIRQQLAEEVHSTQELELKLVCFEGLRTKGEAGLDGNPKFEGYR